MSKARSEIVEELKTKDEEFRRLREEHEDLEHQIEALGAKPALTPHDEMEIKRLKKIKLAGKDKMEAKILQALPAP